MDSGDGADAKRLSLGTIWFSGDVRGGCEWLCWTNPPWVSGELCIAGRAAVPPPVPGIPNEEAMAMIVDGIIEHFHD